MVVNDISIGTEVFKCCWTAIKIVNHAGFFREISMKKQGIILAAVVLIGILGMV